MNDFFHFQSTVGLYSYMIDQFWFFVKSDTGYIYSLYHYSTDHPSEICFWKFRWLFYSCIFGGFHVEYSAVFL
ncbi:hypothetical protein SD53_13575 [Rheinheimera mesophila]|nr:hypothetical protein SD53_13575 [Rheinheimera mesophila]